MRDSKVILNKRDYDVYSFDLPVSFLFGKRREKFIAGELGKRHPCYSDECCFDSRISLKLKGVCSDVVVMNKLRLTELRNENLGKRLCVVERKGCVFDSGMVLLWKKVWFFVLVGSFALMLCVGVAACRKNSVNVESVTGSGSLEGADVDKRIDVKKFFEIVTENKGRCTWFEWRSEEMTENYTASVSLVYPEKFYESGENIVVSAVSYSEGLPSMVVSQKARKSMSAKKDAGVNYVFFVPLIRDILKENKAVFREENANPFSIKFSFEGIEAGKENVISKIGKVAKENEVSISYLMLRYCEDSSFEVQINFAKTKYEGIDLELVGNYLQLFYGKKISKKNVAPAKRVDVATKAFGTKMGEVAYADGSKIVFYKNSDGKIIKNKEFSR